ncbi:terminase small subunit [Stutzerimonas stutzeri]|uniref:terminase small subunit n=1 Tax=Stutzerimonas stutzeri TaxID=316 RepID=UPI00244861F5|nr:terminase small subunit [Stutzerimonas stutzeri]MDH0120828.1 terminase small subunit [Stutzerimonas stutzeri]
MTVMTKAEFADSRGWSRPYVSKLSKQGRLVLTEDGKKVDVEATLALLGETADPSKAGVAERHQRERAEKGVHALVTPLAPPSSMPPAGGGDSYQKARAHREHFLALLAEDEFLKGRGELVERKAVDLAAFNTARTLRDLILGLPPKVAGELVAISDTWEMERRLTELLRSVLEDAASLVQLDAELEQGAKEPN